jgi:uncharacterized membrane protein YdjX (TVP38/TMEM64 family)
MRTKRSKQLQPWLNLPNGVALIVLLGCVGGGWWLISHVQANQLTPAYVLQSLHRLGWLGIFAFISISALAIVVSPIPGTPLTITAGAIWGPIPAGIYAAIGIFAGSMLAYCIGRTLGRSTVRALTGKSIHLSKHRGEVYLGWLMFVSHLFPVLPFDLLSYGAGISRLSLPIYASATLLGTIPGTFLLTYAGSTLKLGVEGAIAILAALLLLLLVLPWAVKRHNWLGLRDVVKLE